MGKPELLNPRLSDSQTRVRVAVESLRAGIRHSLGHGGRPPELTVIPFDSLNLDVILPGPEQLNMNFITNIKTVEGKQKWVLDACFSLDVGGSMFDVHILDNLVVVGHKAKAR
jgi:hypothetical protein